MSSKGNRGDATLKEDAAPAKPIANSIKEQQRFFSSFACENKFHLQKSYPGNRRRLPVCGFSIKKRRTKEKIQTEVDPLLGIDWEKLVLIYSESLLFIKDRLTFAFEQWRSGCGKSRDRNTFEFRATKWSFIASSPAATRSIGSELWEAMQDLDSHFMDDNIIISRQTINNGVRKSLLLKQRLGMTSVHKKELEDLQNLLNFPESVALQLTEVEYDLFYKVKPIHYICQVTVQLGANSEINTVKQLVKRFQEVSSWITHIIVSQPTHEDRKAILTSILRIATTCWSIGNFNTATEILAGLKSEKLKPFWLSLTNKDCTNSLDTLSKALLSPQLSPEYTTAVQRTLASPYNRIIPFFGTFLRELRAILKGIPSFVVLSTEENSKLEFISDFQGEDNFLTRIGYGGLINEEKIQKTHQVLSDIEKFHEHAKVRSHLISKENNSDAKEKKEGTEEDDSLYEIQCDPHGPFVSAFPTSSKSENLQILQFLHHGSTVIHVDDDGSRSAVVYLRLEKNNGIITWCKPPWNTTKGNVPPRYNVNRGVYDFVSPGLLLKCESCDICQISAEEGFLDLSSVKEVKHFSGDISNASKRCYIPDKVEKSHLRLLYGNSLSDNRCLEFAAPAAVMHLWYQGIDYAVSSLKKQKNITDHRISWLKEKYIQLFFEDLDCAGPTPAEAIKVFGGRKWTLGSFGGNSSSVDANFKRAASLGVTTGKLRKKKSTTSLTVIKDCRSSINAGCHMSASTDIIEDYFSKTSSLKPNRSNPSGESYNETGQTQMNIPNATKGSNSRELGQESESPPPVCAPTITHSSQMDFMQFAELFRSFLVRSRKDLRIIFEQVAVSYKTFSENNSEASPSSSTAIATPKKVLGLLTRNTSSDYTENTQRKRICDAIAAASIVSNCAGVDTSQTLVLGIREFRKFLVDHQAEDMSSEEVAALIQVHEPDAELRKKRCLSFEGFARYLMDKRNYAFVPETLKPSDSGMDESLSHYFIASSHNTYLTGHQLKGESSVEIYSQVLLTGCRCVELDCWDGDEGMPVIYHGHTLTTKIPFKSVVEAINRSAFVASPYPVILSIENHCSLQQQTKMAQIFTNVFGDRLVSRFLFDSDYLDDPKLPSPNQLKYRVLIKNKKMRTAITPTLQYKSKQAKFGCGRNNSIISMASNGSFNDEDDDDYEDDEDDEYILDESFKPAEQEGRQNTGGLARKSFATRTESWSSEEEYLRDKALNAGIKISPSILPGSEATSPEEERSKKASSQIAPELSDLVVYCQAIKFRGFIHGSTVLTNTVKMKKINSRKNILSSTDPSSSPGTPPLTAESKLELSMMKKSPSFAPCYQVSSVNESTAKKICKRHPLSLMSHCETQMMRTYPAGMRIDSSNFNPVIFWSFGIQMVALNYQTEDSALNINTAMFEKNGSCGYVLKPRVMWDKSHMMYGRFNPWEKTFDGFHVLNLSITVISGQYVCPASFNGSPQVEVEVIGIPVDCSRQKTKLVQRNSLNPIWNEMLQFRVTFGELAFIRFSVMDMGCNHISAQRVIPLDYLKQGYRHVRLRNLHNQPLPLSTLFIHSTWEEEGIEMSASNSDSIPGEAKDSVKQEVSSTIPVKRKMFFLVVHGVVPDEPSTILKITQDSTTRDVITQALSKNNSNDAVDDYVLIEEVQRGWDKKSSNKSAIRRFLDISERPLEAQAQWKGEGRFILKKLADDPSTRAWITTIRGTINKEKHLKDMNSGDLEGWTDGEEAFLVCVYNVSPDQPYAILKAPTASTALDIIAKALAKARRKEDPNQFALVEEVEYPPLSEPVSSSKKGLLHQRRELHDFENVFLAQQKWKGKGWFEIKEKSQERSNKKSKSSAARKSKNSTKGDGTKGTRQVHSEGEDDTKESAVMKFKRFSLKKLKTWR